VGLLQAAGIHALFRLHQGRPGNGRRSRLKRAKKLGKGDWLVEWKRVATKPKYMSQEDLAKIPDKLTVRVIKVKITAPGVRTRTVVLVTTLLDPKTYPAHAIANLYLQRWQAELTFRNLKSVMQMDILRCKSPEMVQKEILMHLIAHNLIRLLMKHPWSGACRCKGSVSKGLWIRLENT